MIQSFADVEAELIWAGRRSRRLPTDIQATALRKLRLLNQARVLNDLRAPPGNRLEALKGERAGQFEFASTTNGAFVFSGGKEARAMSKSSITTNPQWLANPTPGEILLEEFLRPST